MIQFRPCSLMRDDQREATFSFGKWLCHTTALPTELIVMDVLLTMMIVRGAHGNSHIVYADNQILAVVMGIGGGFCMCCGRLWLVRRDVRPMASMFGVCGLDVGGGDTFSS